MKQASHRQSAAPSPKASSWKNRRDGVKVRTIRDMGLNAAIDDLSNRLFIARQSHKVAGLFAQDRSNIHHCDGRRSRYVDARVHDRLRCPFVTAKGRRIAAV